MLGRTKPLACPTMLGILFYGSLTFGLGLLVPLNRTDDHGGVGLRFVAGTALLVLALYATTVVAALSLRVAIGLIALIATAGWIHGALSAWRFSFADTVLHPAFVLPAAAATVAAAYGRLDYVPYLVDEFTNWIGASRVIHWAGSYEAVRQTLYLAGYTPGWRLLLLAPWQVTGVIDHGLSAAAPLVLHVATLALVYDIALLALRRDAAMTVVTARAAAWLALLLFLTAEGMGRLWTFEMLIEQPQIYVLSAVALLVLRAELTPQLLRILYAIAGLVLAAGFLLKNAVLAAAPGALLIAALPLATRQTPLAERLREFALRAATLLLPLLVTMISWNIVAPQDGCLSSPLSILTARQNPAYDTYDLARRFASAVGSYVLQYKLPVSLAAMAGLALGLYLRLFRGVLFCAAFALVYFISLYWYHLGCFGDYYFHELNSIPRFTRVPVQVAHALGLVLLIVGVALLRRRQWVGVVSNRAALGSGAALALALGLWQIHLTHRTVVDLTTRIYQNADPRIGEMRQAAAFVERHAGKLLPLRPVIAVLGQGQDGDVRAYAEYFARHPVPGGSTSAFSVHFATSWAPTPANTWQTAAGTGTLARELASIDLLWPIQIDLWLLSELRPLVSDEACLTSMPQHALVRERDTPIARFRCQPKDG